MKYYSFIFALVLAFTGFGNSLFAQRSQNLDALSNWDNPNLPSFSNLVYNELWGWADSASGREYAILGTLAETYFIEVTDPYNPVVRDSVPGGHNNCIHRDFKTYKNYCYGVADEGQTSTLQVFDLSYLPDSVHVVYDSSEFFVRSHNIFINEKSGRLYGVGTDTLNGGVIILDIATNPELPTSLGYFNLGAYTHDLYVHNDTIFNNNGYSGMAIWDMTDLNNPDPLGTFSNYPQAGYNHSSWISSDGDHLVMCDETHDRPVRVLDVTDLSSPQIVSTFRSSLLAPQDTKSIAHNPIVIGNYACISYYHDGVQIYDISDPNAPARAAYFDTDTTNTNYFGFKGCWGIYPFLPSGNIIASDVVNGLFVLRPGFAFPNAVGASVTTTGVCQGTPNSGTATALPSGGVGPYSYQWSNGDSSLTTSGLGIGNSYTLTVTDRYGYTGVDTFSLIQNAPWAVLDTIVDESCSNIGDGSISIGINGATPPYTILWSTGDAIPSISGLTSGSYWVLITDSVGCTYSDTFTVGFTNQTPVAMAGSDMNLCIRNTILSGNTPAVGTGTWQVLTGSASINNTNDPQSVVTGLGEGLNSLVWLAANGVCTDADTVNIYVSSAAFVDAGVDTLACGSSHQLAAATPLNGQAQWSNSPGVSFSNNNNPQSTVSNLVSGSLVLTWTVTDSGCTNSDNMTLTVASLPESNFSFSVNNLAVTFTDSSVNASSWFWDFGDAGTSSNPNPIHAYSSPGAYQVCLVVTDTCGADTFCQTVNIQCTPPLAGFVAIDTLLTISLADTSTSAFQNPIYSWDFGDSTTSSLPNPTHSYASPGIYLVCLTITDSCGSQTACQAVEVICPEPEADFVPMVVGNTVTFNNTSTTADPNATYWWDFGDGDNSTQQNPTHFYVFGGTYLACLAVTDTCGTDTQCYEFPVEITVGLEDHSYSTVVISPNPSSERVQIDVGGYSSEEVKIDLIDMHGRLIKSSELILESGEGNLAWKLHSLAAGVYIVVVRGSADQIDRFRLVKE